MTSWTYSPVLTRPPRPTAGTARSRANAERPRARGLHAGRNRALARERAGVSVPWETVPAVGARDASLVVTSSNLQRRHMDGSQRALAPAKLANMDAGRPPAFGAAEPAAEADETVGSGQGQLARLAKLRQLAQFSCRVDAGITAFDATGGGHQERSGLGAGRGTRACHRRRRLPGPGRTRRGQTPGRWRLSRPARHRLLGWGRQARRRGNKPSPKRRTHPRYPQSAGCADRRTRGRGRTGQQHRHHRHDAADGTRQRRGWRLR